jgi:hypothetical protein
MPQEASQGEPCCERELEAGETLWPRVCVCLYYM